MCSVSWFVTKDGYQVFFNRDEQKSRALALPPQTCDVDQVRVLMPIDPTGQGSWISMNEHGLSLCLLNNYQAQTPNTATGFLRYGQISSGLISRGQLLRQLSGSATIKAVAEQFQQLALNQFAPFTLLAFDTQLKPASLALSSLEPAPFITPGSVMAFAWNGQQAHIYPVDSPLFSSGVDLHRVQAHRLQAYQHHIGMQPTTQHFLDFHRNHAPTHPHRSVCMHREDAHTVSFTHLKVSRDDQSMVYIPGSPCGQLTETNLRTHCYRFSGHQLPEGQRTEHRLTQNHAETTTAVM